MSLKNLRATGLHGAEIIAFNQFDGQDVGRKGYPP